MIKLYDYYPYIMGTILILGGIGMIYLNLLLWPGTMAHRKFIAENDQHMEIIKKETRIIEQRIAEITAGTVRRK